MIGARPGNVPHRVFRIAPVNAGCLTRMLGPDA